MCINVNVTNKKKTKIAQVKSAQIIRGVKHIFPLTRHRGFWKWIKGGQLTTVWNRVRVSLLVYLAGSCMARYGAILQAKLTLSFHCFSLRLMYLDLQLEMLVSTDCSVAMASSCVDSGLYQVVSRSISLACKESAEMLKTQECIRLTGTRQGKSVHTSKANSNVLRFM